MDDLFSLIENPKIFRAMITALSDRLAVVEEQQRYNKHLFRALYMLMKAAGVPEGEREEWLADLLGDMKK